MSMTTNWWQVPGAKNPYLSNMYAQQQPTAQPTAPSLATNDGQRAGGASWMSPAFGGQGDTDGYAGSGLGQPWTYNQATPTSDTDLSKAPARTDTPTTATPLGQGNQSNSTYTPVPKSTWEDWLNQSGNFGGQTFNQQTNKWEGGGPVAAGTYILGNSGIRTWVNYDKARDTSLNRFGEAENSESNWHKVNRYAMDYVQAGLSPQEAYNKALSRRKSEMLYDKLDPNSSGFDMSNVPELNQSAAPGQQPGTTTPTTKPGDTPVATQDSNDPGSITPPVSPVTSGQAPVGAAAGQSIYYQGRPQAAVQQFLANRGVATNNHNPFNEILRQIAGKVGSTVADTYNMGGAAGHEDDLARLPQMIADLIYGNGGKTFSNLSNYADTTLAGARDGGAGVLANADVNTAQRLLAGILGLKTMGANRYVANARADTLQSQFDDYENYMNGEVAAGRQEQAQNAGPWWLSHDPYKLWSR